MSSSCAVAEGMAVQGKHFKVSYSLALSPLSAD